MYVTICTFSERFGSYALDSNFNYSTTYVPPFSHIISKLDTYVATYCYQVLCLVLLYYSHTSVAYDYRHT